ncbi:hypothetical protein ABKN59_007976 [Abortiporus biennis]
MRLLYVCDTIERASVNNSQTSEEYQEYIQVSAKKITSLLKKLKGTMVHEKFFMLSWMVYRLQSSSGCSDDVEMLWGIYFNAISYTSMAAFALHEYCLTFDREVEHIWKKRHNLLSIIFVVNRYTVLIGALGATFSQFVLYTRLVSVTMLIKMKTNMLIRHACRGRCLGLIFTVSGSIICSEAALISFFVIRTWAIWGRHPLPLLVLTPLGLGVIVLDALLNFSLGFRGISNLQSPYGGCIIVPTFSGDLGNKRTRYIVDFQDAAASLSITFSFLVLTGTLAKTLVLKRAADRVGIKGNLISLLIRDGSVYLCLTLIVDILQPVLFNIGGKDTSLSIIAGPVTWFRPIVISRMILDLKNINKIPSASHPSWSTAQMIRAKLDSLMNMHEPARTHGLLRAVSSYAITMNNEAGYSSKNAMTTTVSLGCVDTPS